MRRAPITSHTLCRLRKIDPESRGEISPIMVIGTHRSPATTDVPWNPSGVTPMTVNGRPFSGNVWPMMPGSPLKRRFQNA